jgi:hypothetical protein
VNAIGLEGRECLASPGRRLDAVTAPAELAGQRRADAAGAAGDADGLLHSCS